MASGQQWVLVEMVQAFYEVRTRALREHSGGEVVFWGERETGSPPR